ncbi:response regulator transcription factor [Aquimarina mytili]|uniref:Response regulator transcription factor n=1 Tax=Aquimarina mytili TaxID=874423 RepID=A0A936ZXS0_9FLAO|nr:response regulator transcription factor [Aquimarina mytili]MBL0683888.1 response regulator transcription factor [Aquimarina mytili]
MEKKIKLFLVDDHKMFLQGIFSILDEIPHFTIAGIANDGKEALTKLKTLDTDVLITDIEMPKMDGLELIKEIKKINPGIKVIITSSYGKISMIEKAKNLDVEGYLFKCAGKIELLNAIHTVFEGEKYFSEEVQKIHNESLFSSKKTKENKVSLSPREMDVLKCISQEKSTQEISETLHISINTVDTHRKNLMRKIGAKNMVGLVKYAIQQGLI